MAQEDTTGQSWLWHLCRTPIGQLLLLYLLLQLCDNAFPADEMYAARSRTAVLPNIIQLIASLCCIQLLQLWRPCRGSPLVCNHLQQAIWLRLSCSKQHAIGCMLSSSNSSLQPLWCNKYDGISRHRGEAWTVACLRPAVSYLVSAAVSSAASLIVCGVAQFYLMLLFTAACERAADLTMAIAYVRTAASIAVTAIGDVNVKAADQLVYHLPALPDEIAVITHGSERESGENFDVTCEVVTTLEENASVVRQRPAQAEHVLLSINSRLHVGPSDDEPQQNNCSCPHQEQQQEQPAAVLKNAVEVFCQLPEQESCMLNGSSALAADSSDTAAAAADCTNNNVMGSASAGPWEGVARSPSYSLDSVEPTAPARVDSQPKPSVESPYAPATHNEDIPWFAVPVTQPGQDSLTIKLHRSECRDGCAQEGSASVTGEDTRQVLAGRGDRQLGFGTGGPTRPSPGQPQTYPVVQPPSLRPREELPPAPPDRPPDHTNDEL